MKYAILGDIHANLEALTVVLAKAEEENVDKYVCIGDIVGYNSNPHECLELLMQLPLVGAVRGNHDEYAVRELDLAGFNAQAAAAIQWTRQQLNGKECEWLRALPYRLNVVDNGCRFQIVHGTLDSPEHWGYIFDRYNAAASMQYQGLQLCFCGHTHCPVCFDRHLNGSIQDGGYESVKLMTNHKYLFNVGSVGQPRDGDWRAALAIYDTKAATVTLHRLEYDVAACQEKILAAGLPQRLADRLAYGV